MIKRDKTEETLSKCAAGVRSMLEDRLQGQIGILRSFDRLIEAHMTYESELRKDLAQYEPEFPELLNQIPLNWRN